MTNTVKINYKNARYANKPKTPSPICTGIDALYKVQREAEIFLYGNDSRLRYSKSKQIEKHNNDIKKYKNSLLSWLCNVIEKDNGLTPSCPSIELLCKYCNDPNIIIMDDLISDLKKIYYGINMPILNRLIGKYKGLLYPQNIKKYER